MKLNRRGMLATLLGGAVATRVGIPVHEVGADAAATPGHGYYAGEKAAAEREHIAQAIARLKRLAAGDFRPEDRNYPEYGPVDPFSSLRSVSEEGRRFMTRQLQERQWRERTIADAIKALAEYDKTGFLRHIF